MKETTTKFIRIKPSTKQDLDKFKGYENKSYDDVIRELIIFRRKKK